MSSMTASDICGALGGPPPPSVPFEGGDFTRQLVPCSGFESMDMSQHFLFPTINVRVSAQAGWSYRSKLPYKGSYVSYPDTVFIPGSSESDCNRRALLPPESAIEFEVDFV